MMRSATVEVVHGRAAGDGQCYEGPCSIQKVSSGKYNIFPPPGRRIVSVTAVPYTPAQWLMVKTDAAAGRSAQVTFANTAASESDTQFLFTVSLAV